MNLTADRKREIVAETKALAATHGITDPLTVRFNRSKVTAGTAQAGTAYGPAIVTFSETLFANWAESAQADTIRHEIAHLIAGYDAGHGEAWKRCARALGATPEACWTRTAETPAAPYLWVLHCAACGETAKGGWYRKPSGRYSYRHNACGQTMEVRRNAR